MAITSGLTAKVGAATAFLLALGALIDAGLGILTKVQPPTCSLGFSFPWCSHPQSTDSPPSFPETDATRVSAFEFQTPPQEIKAGFRKWSKLAPGVWEELYPDGTKGISYTVKRIHLGDCDGTVASSKEDHDFQVFFPDKNCETKEFMFRRLSQRTTWHSYVPIDHMQ
jgi:hypothetical protein